MMGFPHDTDLQRIHRGELTRDEEIESLHQRVAEWEAIYATICIEKAEVIGKLEACEKERDNYKVLSESRSTPLRECIAESVELHKRLAGCQHYAQQLREAAQEVIARWETPLWKDAPATANYIYSMRDVVNQPSDTSALDALKEECDEWKDRLVACEHYAQTLRDELKSLIQNTQHTGEMQWCGDDELSPWNKARQALTIKNNISALDALVKDAERYRWLRSKAVYEGSSDWVIEVWGRFATVEEAIDAAKGGETHYCTGVALDTGAVYENGK